MHLRKTGILALLLLTAVLYVRFVFLPQQERAANAGKVVAPDNTLQSIAIQRQGGALTTGEEGSASFTLVRRVKNTEQEEKERKEAEGDYAPEHWALEAVPSAPIDKGAMNSLLTALRDLNPEEPLPAEEVESDLSVYGLDQPQLRLDLATEQGPITIEMGKLSQYLRRRYARFSDREGIYLIGDMLYQSANKQRDDFRSKTPISFSDQEVAKVVLTSPRGSFTVVRGDAGKWQITDPIALPASAEVVERALRDVRNLRALKFLEPESEMNALPDAQVSVKIEFKEESGKAPLEVRLSAPQEDTSRGTIFWASSIASLHETSPAAEPVKALSLDLSQLRERKLFAFALDHVQQVDLQRATGDQITIRREGDSWRVNGKPGDRPFVEEVLQNLSNLEAVAFPSEKRDYGFNTPRLRVLVQLAAPGGDPETRELVVGNEAPAPGGVAAYFAATGEPREVFQIAAEAFKRISPLEEALLKVEEEDEEPTEASEEDAADGSNSFEDAPPQP